MQARQSERHKAMHKLLHTPGPWSHDENCAGRILGHDGIAICAVYGSAARAQEDDCNQMLIAAAPELLEALIELQQMVEAGENNPGTHEIVRLAIAKAMGTGNA